MHFFVIFDAFGKRSKLGLFSMKETSNSFRTDFSIQLKLNPSFSFHDEFSGMKTIAFVFNTMQKDRWNKVQHSSFNLGHKNDCIWHQRNIAECLWIWQAGIQLEFLNPKTQFSFMICSNKGEVEQTSTDGSKCNWIFNCHFISHCLCLKNEVEYAWRYRQNYKAKENSSFWIEHTFEIRLKQALHKQSTNKKWKGNFHMVFGVILNCAGMRQELGSF